MNKPSIPRTTVLSIFRSSLDKLQLSSNAADCIIDLCYDYILKIAETANEICCKDSRTVINNKHVLAALRKLRLGEYADKLCDEYKCGLSEKDCAEKLLFRKKKKRSKEVNEELKKEQEAAFQQAKDSYMKMHLKDLVLGETQDELMPLEVLHEADMKLATELDSLYPP